MDTNYLELRADEVRAGDIWLCNSEDRVRVTGVVLEDDEAFVHHGEGPAVARISGKIIRGWGSGTSGTWTKLASAGCEVLR